MKATPTEVGRVVESLMGHDAGRWFVIVKVLELPYVMICDGETRGLEKPKRKQAKHLKALPITIPVTGKGGSGGEISDSDIRKALAAARMQYQFDGGRETTAK